MRKILISLLLAGAAATPAIAGPHDWSDRQSAQQDRQSAREERQAARDDRAQARADNRADRSANFSRGPAPEAAQVRQQSFNGGGVERANVRPDRGYYGGRYDGNAGPAYVAPGARMVEAPRGQERDQLRAQRMQDRQVRQQDVRDARDLRQSDRAIPNVIRDRRPLAVSDVPRFGTQPPLRAESHTRWNTNWRNDGRYDWRDRRRHHRSLFHLGLYFDPFGWGYQPFSIGYRMWPAYYGNQFWIDPGLYGLPYPPPGAVWIRYFNDAMLIDTYSGTILDVIPAFFW
jgi:Ni/Co efflux regulator RcnB